MQKSTKLESWQEHDIKVAMYIFLLILKPVVGGVFPHSSSFWTMYQFHQLIQYLWQVASIMGPHIG